MVTGNLLHYNVLLATTVIGALTIIGYWYRKSRQNRMPTIWEPVGKVKHLFIYPLKSGRRMEIKEAECTEYGLKLVTDNTPQLRDRCLIVYKENNKELRTARNFPHLLLVETTAMDKESFTITAPNMETLHLKVPKMNKDNTGEVSLWFKEKVFMIDCGDEAAQWFSQYLEGTPSGLRLGFHDGQHRRDIGGHHKNYTKEFPIMKNMSGAMYSDVSSILLMGQASVDDLKSRVPNINVSIHNFRPNIVVEDMKPYEEDTFEWIKIGDAVLRTIIPCPRCSVPNIDPDTALRSADYEPHKTLKSYRKMRDIRKTVLHEQDPVLGLYMCIKQFGKVCVGDVVYLGK